MAGDLVQRAQIMPLSVEQTRQAMTVHQQQLSQIVDESDWQVFTSRGERRRFLKRSGWTKIAFWYALDLEVLHEELERDERGDVIRAHVIARARHPNGRYADGDGGCSRTERGFAKPEHDIAAVAHTRARNRAISNLVGAGDLSAEELDGAGGPGDAPPVLDNDGERVVVEALEGVWPDYDAVNFLAKLEKRFGGAIPEAAGAALRAWAWYMAQPSGEGSAAPQTGAQGVTDAPARDET